MIEVKATIVNTRGLHARPSAKLAKLAATYDSTLTIYKGKRKADAKSVAALLMLAAAVGTELKIVASGKDEKQAAATLVEMIASGFSDDAVLNNPQKPEAAPDKPAGNKQVHKISGIGIGNAVVSGNAHIYVSGTTEVPRYRIEKTQLTAEIQRYENAILQVQSDYNTLIQKTADMPGAAEIRPFIDLHLMLLSDEEFVKKTPALIRRRLMNAEWALKERVEVIGDNFRRIEDDYLRERHHDIEQVMERLLTALEGSKPQNNETIAAGENALLIAADLDPADVIRLRQQGYKGFITESGGANSHTAILARSMDIPALMGARGVLACTHHNARILMDTCKEVAIINPASSDIKRHKQIQKKKKSTKRRGKSGGNGVVSKDGEQIYLNVNIEMPDEVDAAKQNGADGVGLYRTEFLFMHRNDLPSEDEQFEVYRHVLASMHPLPVVIRTLDIGGDKMPNAMDTGATAVNPALSVRAIRYCLAHPDLFMTQLRALLRAYADYDNLRILLPMLAHEQELERTITLLAAAQEQIRATRGIQAALPPLGAMIEVPAAVFIMQALSKQLNFFSIGTNDLIQYTMAADRNDETLVPLCDPLHPAILQLLAQIVSNASRHNLPVTLCGELAGDVSLTPLILGMGLRHLSMTPVGLDSVRACVQQADCSTYARMARHVLRAPSSQAAREIIAATAADL